MKLELKHLSPYLPYSLKLIVSSVDGNDCELLELFFIYLKYQNFSFYMVVKLWFMIKKQHLK